VFDIFEVPGMILLKIFLSLITVILFPILVYILGFLSLGFMYKGHYPNQETATFKDGIMILFCLTFPFIFLFFSLKNIISF
jgi:hypothetical protein